MLTGGFGEGTVPDVELEPNSSPYFLKRLISDGFDTVVLFLLFMVLTLVAMNTPLARTYNEHYERYETIRKETLDAYGTDLEGARDALNSNEEFRYELFAANLHSYLLKALACLVSEAVLFLLVPLLNRNRMTFGKLLTGVMPFHTGRRSRATPMQVFGRFLFILLLYSLPWYLLTGIYTFLLIPVLRLTVMLLNKKRRTLQDVVTGVVMIEKKSFDGV